MNPRVNRRSMGGLIALLFAAIAGCVAGGAYDGGVDVGYGVDFYDAGGYEYGGWGPGYGVGPPRRGFDRGRADGRGAPHSAYRPASPSRSMPSLPGRSRGR